MNYIGSKYSLLGDIEQMLADHQLPRDGIALDLFAGTGAVAQLLKRRGHIVYANDWQHYAYVTNVAFLELNAYPTFDALLGDPFWSVQLRNAPQAPILAYSIQHRGAPVGDLACTQVLSYLNALPGDGANPSSRPFFDSYCQGGSAGRTYFSRDNGRRIQAIRDRIEAWSQSGLLTAAEKAWLIACLIESADRVANTASVYGAYLKRIKKTAQKPLTLVALKPIASPHLAEQHRVFCQDGLSLLHALARAGARASASEPLRLIYVDPPYNHRQYAANYHILETIARWDLDRFEPRGVTGLRDDEEQRSDYSLRSRVEDGFRQLFEAMHTDYVLFSYNNEGLLPEDKLLGLFDEFCTEVDFRQIRFKRFRADVDRANRVYKADHTHEFLVFGKLKISA
ncbi:MAG: DNA adenine methylase [Anaerolineae bacterium]|nr:DNA adenine methylase [Anaerolineae bacterium]